MAVPCFSTSLALPLAAGAVMSNVIGASGVLTYTVAQRNAYIGSSRSASYTPTHSLHIAFDAAID